MGHLTSESMPEELFLLAAECRGVIMSSSQPPPSLTKKINDLVRVQMRQWRPRKVFGIYILHRKSRCI